MRKSLILLISILNVENGLYLIVSLFVFLFVISFLPFSPQYIDYHQPLLFALVLGGIVFLTILIVRAVYPCFVGKDFTQEKKSIYSTVFSGFIIWLLSSVVFLCYLGFVESISISLYLVYKVVLVCLAPPLILANYDMIVELKIKNESLRKQGKTSRNKIEERDSNKPIRIHSENGLETFSVFTNDVLFIKSADNYVEIHYQDEGHLKKKLIRCTMKNIEYQIKPYPFFLRSHRTCIVNINCVEKFNANCKSPNLIMNGYDKKIPVSRQYVLKIREAL